MSAAIDPVPEAAFQIYRRFIREPDEARARHRFARLKPERREEWEGDAKAAFRVFSRSNAKEIYDDPTGLEPI